MLLEVHNFTQNKIDEPFIKKIGQVALETLDQEKLFSPEGLSGKKIEISLAIVGDGRMRKLNKMYRGKNRVTDVLAFAHKSAIPYLKHVFPSSRKGQEPNFVEPPDGVERLGEIIICYPQAKKQAGRMGHPLKRELAILFVHGLLHLLGYDHEQGEKEARQMEELGNRILLRMEELRAF